MGVSLGKTYSIVKLDTNTKEIKTLYDYIPNLQQADLLAQLSMCNKHDYELIYITPGWNLSIDKNHPTEYEEALRLAKKYECTR